MALYDFSAATIENVDDSNWKNVQKKKRKFDDQRLRKNEIKNEKVLIDLLARPACTPMLFTLCQAHNEFWSYFLYD